MVNFFKSIIKLLFPPCCMCCKTETTEYNRLCSNCYKNITWIEKPYCKKCGYPFPANIDLSDNTLCPNCITNKIKYIDWIRSITIYNNATKKIILPLKHANKTGFIKLFTSSIIRKIKEYNHNIDLIIPMPLSTKRLFHRGYNQATLLAKPISKQLNIPIKLNLVHRKHNKPMGHLTFKQRFQNIHGIFNIDKKNYNQIKNKTILIIDDVMTSGASIFELSKTLKKAGAKTVIAIVISRVIKDI